MALLVLLICISLQRYTQLRGYCSIVQGLYAYFRFILLKFLPLIQRHGLIGVLILLLPLIIAVSCIYLGSFHLWGVIAEFVVSVLLVWFCMDASVLKSSSALSTEATELFIVAYQRVFAIIFWFVVCLYLGIIPALIIYPVLLNLQHYLEKSKDSGLDELFNWTTYSLGIIDWVPLRLLGLSFAMVGHFAPVFTLWCKSLYSGIKGNQQLIKELGMMALEKRGDTLVGETVHTQEKEVTDLLDRALILWLVVITVLTFGIILGQL